MSSTVITKQILDAFSNHVRIAMHVASETLSSLARTSIGVEKTSSEIYPLHKFHALLQDPEAVYTSVIMGIDNGEKGVVAVSILEKDAVRFAQSLVSQIKDASSQDVEALGVSALEDAANILVGSFFAEISRLSGTSFVHTSPVTVTDMIHASLDEPVFDFAGHSPDALVLKTEIALNPLDVHAHIITVLEEGAAKTLLSSLAV